MDEFRAKLASGPGFDDFVRGDDLPGAAYSLAAPASLKDKSVRKPAWMKRTVPSGDRYVQIKSNSASSTSARCARRRDAPTSASVGVAARVRPPPPPS